MVQWTADVVWLGEVAGSVIGCCSTIGQLVDQWSAGMIWFGDVVGSVVS
jgi:hypothetical protein